MNKFIRLIALVICAMMLVSSLTCLSVLAESSDESDESKTWEDIWKEVKQPAYTTTAFASVKERILGVGEIESMWIYAVIDGYAFYADSLTGEMIFLSLKDEAMTKEQILEEYYDEESGRMTGIPEYSAFYCTNPYNAGGAKAIGQSASADATEKQKLLSQIIIKFSANDKDSTMGSFEHAAANQQISINNIRGGVRVEYTIGREEVIYLVPRLIRKEKLEALRDQVKENSTQLRDYNVLMAFYLLKDKDDATLSEKTRDEMLKNYPIVNSFAVYACEPTISTQELLRLEKLIKNYTNYDYDTLDADHAETEYVSHDDVPPLFKLALEYRVEGEEITIRVNAGNIRFNSSMYKLSDVMVLPYGGAGDVNNSGYMFSPDGSGSLIDFSDLSSQFTNSNTLYGQDYAYHTISGQNKEISRLPVFGVYQRIEKDTQKAEMVPVIDPDTGDYLYDDEGNVVTEEVMVDVPLEIAYLAVIEEGDSLAKININYGGPVHNYASIYTSFNPRPKDSYVLDGGISVGTDAMWTVESKRKYTGAFKLRLFILDGTEDGDESTSVYDADKSYSDMAAAYRTYLVRTGVLKDIEDLREDVPLYLETLGALEGTDTIMGIPVDTMIALTTFDDTKKIIDELNTAEIENIKIRLNAWYNGGVMGSIATSIEIEEVLGGEEGFKGLVDYAKEKGVTLFPDIELSIAYRDENFDGFAFDEDLSQTIDDRPASYQKYNPVMQAFQSFGTGGVISPMFMKELYTSAANDYNKFEVGAISVGTVGEYLSSDFNKDNPLTREDSKELVIQLLELINTTNDKVMVNAGNDYTLPYVTDILELPLDDSRLLYSYATVPFMSMVLHSYIEYAGIALNLAGDYNYHLLKTIESGASPYFVIACNNTSDLKQYSNHEIAQYYSVSYGIWKEDILKAYNTVNEALSDVQNSPIRKHEIVSSDAYVVKVIYENGISFYMNYDEIDHVATFVNPETKEETEITVPAGGYVKIGADHKVINVWEGVE